LSAVAAWTIEHWPAREQSDALLAEVYSARAALHEEAEPNDPRRPLAVEIAEVRNLPPSVDGVALVARDAAGSIAGLAWCWWEDLPGRDHALMAHAEVLPGSRRQGLGRLLLDGCARVAQQRRLRLVIGRTRDNVPSGAAFCARLGAELAMVGQENRLDLRTVDRALVDRWLDEGPLRAPGYGLEFVAGLTPPRLAEQAAEVLNVINTAPRENLDVGDVPITPALLHEYETADAAAGVERWAYYAVQEATGRFVGLTDINIRPDSPDRVEVGATAVDRAHRGRSLGKWLKAAMTRKILDQLPSVRWVITFNAGSNDAMLAINTELGFRTVAVRTTWQLATDRLSAVTSEKVAHGPAD
jgi:mycothiol synthase